jgi:isopentenyl-diphosphate delta-isomerase
MTSFKDLDANAPARKNDHIALAFQSQMEEALQDRRFIYEPLLAAHPTANTLQPFTFLGAVFKLPLWVSSMTGGTKAARHINANLAKACGEYGFGMGLGSCRSLLFSNEYLADFAVRKYLKDAPLFANLGIAQVEKLLFAKQTDKIKELVEKLEANGLIIHINPLQEWLQPEGDQITQSPITTIIQLLETTDIPLIVKEVGQGMGKESLRALLQLPLAAVDFAAYGGTNFSQLELLRSHPEKQQVFQSLARLGHTADEMVDWVNELVVELGDDLRCEEIIISGGVKNFLDGYYLRTKLTLPSVYGQASAFLKYAQNDYEGLQSFIESQARGLAFAQEFLRVK